MTALHIVCPHCHSTNRVPEQKMSDAPQCGKCHQALFTGSAIELTSTHFSQHINKSDIPVVVDFWAPWCGPCQMMAPIFEQAAAQFAPKALLAKVNTESEQGLAMQFGIRSIPTLAVFKGGKEVGRQAGAMDLGRLQAWLQPYL